MPKTPNPTLYPSTTLFRSYTYLLTNTGNVAISAISVSDNKIATVTCPGNSLAVGANMTCTGTYVTKTSEVHKSIVKTHRATGSPLKRSLTNATAQATVTFTAQPT